MRAGRYWMRLSRFFMIAASSLMDLPTRAAGRLCERLRVTGMLFFCSGFVYCARDAGGPEFTGRWRDAPDAPPGAVSHRLAERGRSQAQDQFLRGWRLPGTLIVDRAMRRERRTVS